MTIFEYYKEQQSNQIWYNKFQSTSNKQSGKTFSYINTNFRFIMSFLVQFERFKSKLGKDRKDWKEKLPCGQEMDKHRVTNLTQAGFIKSEDNYYKITSKGIVLCDLIEERMKEEEKWILLFLLLLDYNTLDRKLDILFTVKELYYKLNKAGFDIEWINENLYLNLNNKDKIHLFNTDIFWLISFSNDAEFLRLFKASTNVDKSILKNYVISCSKDEYSVDLISHKFKNSGAYSGKTFNDDIKMIFFTNLVIKNGNKGFDDFIDSLIFEYSKIFLSGNREKIDTFIRNHKSIFIKIKQNILGGIN